MLSALRRRRHPVVPRARGVPRELPACTHGQPAVAVNNYLCGHTIRGAATWLASTAVAPARGVTCRNIALVVIRSSDS